MNNFGTNKQFPCLMLHRCVICVTCSSFSFQVVSGVTWNTVCLLRQFKLFFELSVVCVPWSCLITRPVTTILCHKWQAKLPYPICKVVKALISFTWPLNQSQGTVHGPSTSHDLPFAFQVTQVPSYAAWWRRHLWVNNLAKVVTWESNPTHAINNWSAIGVLVFQHSNVRNLDC